MYQTNTFYKNIQKCINLFLKYNQSYIHQTSKSEQTREEQIKILAQDINIALHYETKHRRTGVQFSIQTKMSNLKKIKMSKLTNIMTML